MLFFKQKKENKEDVKKNSLQNPKILEVNLIRGEAKISFDWNKYISILVVVLFVVASFISEIYFGLDWWAKQEAVKAESLDAEIIKVKNDISKIKSSSDEALAYKDKSVEVDNLFNNHIYWSNFFSWIEKNTLSTVKFGGFNGDTKGSYALDAKALSYAEVSWQTKAYLNDPIVKNVNVLRVDSAISADKTKQAEPGVSFSLNLDINPDIFKK